MTSEPAGAFVWIWMPGETDPVVAGRIERRDQRHVFFYAGSYLARSGAVAIYEPELPLDNFELESLDGDMPLCIDDAAPDSWGRAVINAVANRPGVDLDPLTYLLESGSSRVGAIDFQTSADTYQLRAPKPAPLEQLIDGADRIAAGEPIDEHLAAVLVQGSPLGGARPKALLVDADGTEIIAKLSRTTDTFLWVQAEYVAMDLARRAGINVAPVRYVESQGRSVILVDRFDRPPEGGRRRVVSAATILGMQTIVAARHFTYVDFADAIRTRFTEPDATLRELYSRISFNILVGNTDDHARNHAAFPLTGLDLELTPAYDIAPQPRAGEAASHPRFGEGDDGRDSRIAPLVAAAPRFHLAPDEAQEISDHQVDTIRSNWSEVCDAAHLTAAQRTQLLGGPILNDFAFYS